MQDFYCIVTRDGCQSPTDPSIHLKLFAYYTLHATSIEHLSWNKQAYSKNADLQLGESGPELESVSGW